MLRNHSDSFVPPPPIDGVRRAWQIGCRIYLSARDERTVRADFTRAANAFWVVAIQPRVGTGTHKRRTTSGRRPERFRKHGMPVIAWRDHPLPWIDQFVRGGADYDHPPKPRQSERTISRKFRPPAAKPARTGLNSLRHASSDRPLLPCALRGPAAATISTVPVAPPIVQRTFGENCRATRLPFGLIIW